MVCFRACQALQLDRIAGLHLTGLQLHETDVYCLRNEAVCGGGRGSPAALCGLQSKLRGLVWPRSLNTRFTHFRLTPTSPDQHHKMQSNEKMAWHARFHRPWVSCRYAYVNRPFSNAGQDTLACCPLQQLPCQRRGNARCMLQVA